jgi:hypothetical protein
MSSDDWRKWLDWKQACEKVAVVKVRDAVYKLDVTGASAISIMAMLMDVVRSASSASVALQIVWRVCGLQRVCRWW